jgi:membrane protein DedA with SNARE-associated domain
VAHAVLVAAALLAATTGPINIVVVVLAAAAGAIVGDAIGYTVGRTLGVSFIRRYGRYIHLDEDRLLIGRYLFFQYGNAVVFFGRFIAMLRMFSALLARQWHAGGPFPPVQCSWRNLLVRRNEPALYRRAVEAL